MINLFDTAGFRSQTGGQIKNFIARDHIPRNFSIKRMSRADMLSFCRNVGSFARRRTLSPAGRIKRRNRPLPLAAVPAGFWKRKNSTKTF